jgi:hypothetical protein
MHYRVFRARSAEGKLTLSDWTDAPPTNRTPQEIVLDFIQIEPYFEEESRRD